MELKDFEYQLPEELIAQHPAAARDSSRLMVLDRAAGTTTHRAFKDIKEYLRPGDLLVLNKTRVIPARLIGTRPTGGKVEVLLVRRLSGGPSADDTGGELWRCMARPSRRLRPGSVVDFDHGLRARAVSRDAEGYVVFEFTTEGGAGFDEEVDRVGRMPLPPYIRRGPDDPGEDDAERYQTVFATERGAVAAPTAGLHFTEELLTELCSMGVDVRFVTLHTGPGTFMTPRVSNIEDHRMLKEHYHITPGVFSAVMKAKDEGRRVWAVGSTSTRALEASVLDGFDSPRLEGDTDLFIYPGFRFKVVDALLTNFHLPGSTLMMLVAAFGGFEFVMEAYRTAVRERYRFYSYGDAMLVL